jgi:hypothetical protein
MRIAVYFNDPGKTKALVHVDELQKFLSKRTKIIPVQKDIQR